MTITPEQAQWFANTFTQMANNVELAVRGKERTVRLVLTCLLSEGHMLLEDNPGTGKTQLAKALANTVKKVLDFIAEPKAALALPLDLRGTAFQVRVWEALRRIPPGETRSYAQLAAMIDAPKAVRAVARSCATNPVSLAVPCHRVVGSDGDLTGYRWGVPRKREMLARERRAAGSG